MKRAGLYILLFIATNIINTVFGQEFSMLNYTVNDGLPSNQITSTCEDSYGFLWIGTNNGVSRFNGKSFVNYGYTEGLRNLFVGAIYEDSCHRLWIGTLIGISQLKGNRFITSHIKKNIEFAVFGFKEINAHELLAITDKGLYRFADSMWAPADINSGNDVHSIISVTDGIYLNYGNKLLFKSKDSLLTIAKSERNSDYSYFSDMSESHNRIFISTKTCLYEIVRHQLKLLINNIPSKRIFWYYVDKDNNYWLLIENKGLYRYQLLPGKKEKILLVISITNALGYPFADSYGNLWLASYNGLLRLQPKKFREIYINPKNTFKRLYIASAGNNQLLIFGAGGPKYYNNGQITNVPLPLCYKNLNNYLKDVIEGDAKDGNNNTWFITRFRKLFCWHDKRLVDFSNLLPSQHEQYINNLAADPVTNRIFLCGDSTVIAGNEKKFGKYHDKNGKTFSKVSCILFTHNGIGIVKVISKGVYFITKQNEIIKAPHELDIIDKGNYTYFFEDRNDCIWVSNAGTGLIRFSIADDYKVKNLLQFNTANGLPDNKIISMAFDTHQNAWINTYKDVAVMLNATNNFSPMDVYPIGWEQGIMHEVSFTSQLSADNAGNIYVPAIDKVIQFNIDSLQLKKVIPKIVIEKIMLNMQETNWALYKDSLFSYFQIPYKPNLNYSQNSLGIQFIGTCLTDASNIEYSYKLKPVDTVWSAPSSNNFVSFLKLAPENYTFQVKARASNSVWSNVVSYNFVIHKPFWATWLFRLVIIIIASYIITAIFIARVKKIRKDFFMRNQLKELEMKALKAQMNPHFIYNALNSIQALVANDKKEEGIFYIGSFSRLLRQVLDNSENNVISLDKELETVGLYIQLEELRLDMHLQYEIFIAPDIVPEFEKIPPLILQPFVENALWHGLSRKEGEKEIKISVSTKGNWLICDITDNGIGRVKTQELKNNSIALHQSKAIDITRKRLADFNEDDSATPIEFVDLYDSENKAAGTKVIVHIKQKGSQPSI